MKINRHALLRMQQRGIDENSIASALSDPDETGESFRKRRLARKTIGDKTLEVDIEEDDKVVITAYWLEDT